MNGVNGMIIIFGLATLGTLCIMFAIHRAEDRPSTGKKQK